MQGAWINGERPKSKKALREAVIDAPGTVSIEATAFTGTEYDGPVEDMPEGKVYIAGPDPYTKRNWYAMVTRKGDRIKVS
jgi:hypothetical protein